MSGNIYSKLIFKLWIKIVILWNIHKRYSYSERFSSVYSKRILPFTCSAIAIKYDQRMLQIVNTVIATLNEANKTFGALIWLNIFRQLQTRLYHVTQVVVSNCSIAPLTETLFGLVTYIYIYVYIYDKHISTSIHTHHQYHEDVKHIQ